MQSVNHYSHHMRKKLEIIIPTFRHRKVMWFIYDPQVRLSWDPGLPSPTPMIFITVTISTQQASHSNIFRHVMSLNLHNGLRK